MDSKTVFNLLGNQKVAAVLDAQGFQYHGAFWIAELAIHSNSYSKRILIDTASLKRGRYETKLHGLKAKTKSVYKQQDVPAIVRIWCDFVGVDGDNLLAIKNNQLAKLLDSANIAFTSLDRVECPTVAQLSDSYHEIQNCPDHSIATFRCAHSKAQKFFRWLKALKL